MVLSVYPFKEIEERQKALRGVPAPEPVPQAQKQFVLSLPLALGGGAASYSELRRFVIADLHARLHRLQGSAVRFGASWDGFGGGLWALAREKGTPAGTLVERDHEEIQALLSALAVTIDRDAEAELHRPECYRWAQWVFIQLVRRGLVLRRSPHREPVGAAGVEEKGRAAVRPGKSWFLDLSSLGDRLLNDLDRANWPVADKKDQRYRIGRRRGCEVIFQVSHAFQMEVEELPVFTTQVEAIYGATFILIHPNHPALPAVLDPGYEEDLQRYLDRMARGSESRISGVRTGGFAINPANLKRIPVLVSPLSMDPFLGDAVMGVPAHDPDQFELARRLYLPIREAIRGPGARYDAKGNLKEAYTGDGTLTNSSIFSGLPVRVARERIIAYLQRRGIASRVTRFRLHQVPISVSSVWGAPVPVLHCSQCGEVPVPEEALPLVLPDHVGPLAVNPGPKGSGGAGTGGSSEPLDLRAIPGYSATSCPICSGPAERDPQVLAPWLSRALGFLRSATGEAPLTEEACTLSPPAPDQAPVGEPGVAAGPGESPPAAPGLDAEAPVGSGLVTASGPPPPGGDKSSASPPEAARAPEGAGAPAEEAGPAEAAEPEGAAGQPAAAEVLPEDRELFPERPLREYGEYRARRAPVDSEEDGRPGPSPPAVEERSGGVPPAADLREAELDEPEEEEEEEGEEGPARPAPVFESRFHPFRLDSVRRWLPADAAFGGQDHGALFLLLLRSITKFLHDIGEIEFQEPFYRYLRLGRVEPAPAAPPGPAPARPAAGAPARKRALPPSPAEAIEAFGADAFRLALIGLAPVARPSVLESSALWGAQRFLDRVWRQVTLRMEKGKFVSRAVLEAKHRLIHNTTQRLRRFKFHTALASLHEFVNFLEASTTSPEEMDRSALRTFLIVLWPFAPHLADELWSRLGETGSIRFAEWPEAKLELLKTTEREIPVRIDGRICQRLKVPAGLEREKLEAQALRDERVQATLAGRPATRVIAVADRAVNILTVEKTAQPPPPAPPSPSLQNRSSVPPAQ